MGVNKIAIFIMNIIKVVKLGHNLVYIFNDFELHTDKSLAIHG